MLDLNYIERVYFKYLEDKMTISEIETWVYTDEKLEEHLINNDYLDLISIDYRSSYATLELKKILSNYISYEKYEYSKLRGMLTHALSKPTDIHLILEFFYYLYCVGYEFLRDLGMSYGLICCSPYRYADTWEELSTEKQKEIIAGFYPELTEDLERVLNWLDNGLIVLKGKAEDYGKLSFIDNRKACDRIDKRVKVVHMD